MTAGQQWTPGQRVEATDKFKAAGPFPGTVDSLAGIYVLVRYDDPTLMAGRLDQFYAESGWRAWDGEVRWRLRAVTP